MEGFSREGWYQHSCGHEEFYWPEQWFPYKCRRCHKTSMRWAWVPGYMFRSEEDNFTAAVHAVSDDYSASSRVQEAVPYIRNMVHRDVMEWLIKRDKDLAAELYIALTEGRIW
jgi:hypothetical protein